MIHCPRCGKPVDPNLVTRNLCSSCYLSTRKPSQESYRLEVCPSCGAVRIGGVWNFSESLDGFVSGFASTHLEDKRDKVQYTKGKNVVYVAISRQGHDIFLAKINFRWGTCPRCLLQKNHSYMYEIKIRIDGRPLNKREVLYMRDFVSEVLTDLAEGFTFELTENKYGIDIQLSSKKGYNRMLSALRSRFLGRETSSYRLVGETHDRRRVYRTTASYRILSIEEGNVFRMGKDLLEVRSTGKNIVLKNIKSGHSLELERFRMVELLKKGEAQTLVQKGQIPHRQK